MKFVLSYSKLHIFFNELISNNPVNSNKNIIVENYCMRGNCFYQKVNEHINYLYLDITIKDAFTISLSKDVDDELWYSIHFSQFNLENPFTYTTNNKTWHYKSISDATLFITNNKIPQNYIFEPNGKVRICFVAVSNTWAKEHLNPTIYKNLFEENLLKMVSLFDKLKMSYFECNAIENLHQCIITGKEPLKKVLIILDLLDKLLNRITLFLQEHMHEKIKAEDVRSIQQIEHYIKIFVDTPMPSIKEIAKKFNCREVFIEKNFKLIYGKTIYQYHKKYRLEISKEWLSKKSFKISFIANKVGFENASKYSAAFYKNFGMLPREYLINETLFHL